jgi:hypothetical protein
MKSQPAKQAAPWSQEWINVRDKSTTQMRDLSGEMLVESDDGGESMLSGQPREMGGVRDPKPASLA